MSKLNKVQNTQPVDAVADRPVTDHEASPDRRVLLKKIVSAAALPAVSAAFIASDVTDAFPY